METALTGWGGRIRTSEWRNQNLPDSLDFITIFSRLKRKALLWINTLPVISRLSNKSITHSYHGYELALHHKSDDRYRVTILDPKGNRVASTGTHLERQGALTEASRYVNQLLAKRRAT